MLLQPTTRAVANGRSAPGGDSAVAASFARRRGALVLALALACVLLAPAAAQSSTLSFFRIGTIVEVWTFTASSGDQNVITVNPGATGRFLLHDDTEAISVSEFPSCAPNSNCGCTGSGTTTVSCALFDSLTISTGDQNDTVTGNAGMAYPLFINGQDGVDQLHGGGAGDTIDGGTGNDTSLTGAGGNDTIRGGSGADSGIDGGGGSDTLSYNDGRTTGVTASLTSNDNSDSDEFVGVMEVLEGTQQADTLSGTQSANTLNGLDGNDVLIGAAGADTLNGGDGADTASYEERATAVTAALGGANIDADLYSSIRNLTGGGGDDALTGDATANTLQGGGGDDVLAGAGAADSLIGGPGRNIASYDERATAVAASLAPLGPRPDGDTYAQIQSLRGGAGDDTLTGDAATNRLEGGAGDDVLVGGDGDDDLIGGAGRNTASYEERTTPVAASLAPAGPKPDSDVYDQIQNLRGGAGDDTLTGDGGPNAVDGRAGDDSIAGLAGLDDLRGATGADTINARDGAADTVDCGANGDTASVDLVDTTTACEALRFPDSDGDGADDSRDCDRANAAIHPGAAEIIDNAVDENCDGVAAVTPDGDGDGFNKRLDCDDENPRIRPGAREIPGNTVDENCDSLKPDFPLIGASIAISTQSRTRFTKVLEVVVTAIPKGGRVELRCKPPKRARRACPFKRVKRAFPDGRRRIDLARRFKGRRLPVGTVIELRVTAPETIGKVSTRRVGRSSTKRRLQCLRPGAKRPSRCPNS